MSKRLILLLGFGISLLATIAALTAHFTASPIKPSKASIIHLLNGRERSELEQMLVAAQKARAYLNLLQKKGSSIDQELKDPGQIRRCYVHYPSASDVYDDKSKLLYYYHCHRPGEEGHFHLFLIDPPHESSQQISLPQKEDTFSHIVALSIDKRDRRPFKLFCTNAWVTGEVMLTKEAITPSIKQAAIEDTKRTWITSSALAALLQTFLPQIEKLLSERDSRFSKLQKHLGVDANTLAKDHNYEIFSEMPIDLDSQIEALHQLLS